MAASTLHTEVLAAETSLHLESVSASHRGLAASLLAQSELHMAAPMQRCLQVPGHGGKHSSHRSASWRQRRARTLSPPPPLTVKQPQACLISRGSSIAKTSTCRPWCRRLITAASTLHTTVLAAETSMHHESASASASNREAAASLLDHSELHNHGGSDAKVLGAWSRRQALSTH